MATIVLFFVRLALSGLTPSQLVERARAIITALTGNASFTTPEPPLAVIGTSADSVEAADAAVLNNGGRQDYVARNERVRELRALLTLLGSYVQVTSAGDREKILSAGFQTRRTHTPAGLLPAPGNLRAVASQLMGVIDLRWDRVAHRLIYQLEFNVSDPTVEANWKPLALVGMNAYSATGLTSGALCSFRVRAIGAAGPGPASDTATDRAK